MSGQRSTAWLLVAILCVVGGYAARGFIDPGGADENLRPNAGTPNLDFIVGGPDPFWQITIAGAKDAASEHGANLEVHVPSGEPRDQTEVLTRVSVKDTDGVAISPVAPDNQSLLISRLAGKAYVVTFDNDAPQALRHCYIGTNNYQAGHLSARAVKEALPDGGTIAVFIGDVERNNAQERRRGFYDAILGERSSGDSDAYPPDEPRSGGGYTILKTYLDGQNADNAEKNATAAIAEHPDLDCMVGLYGYNGPSCLKALREADKAGQTKLIAFDEHEETLKGIADGDIEATVVQDPYQYGYEAIRLLATLHSRVETATPLGGSGSVFVPCKIIGKDDVAEYQAELAERTKEAS